VVASRLKIGLINSDDEEGFIPAEERFYSGGSTSVRGWARQQLGPRNERGAPIGGKSLLEGGLEFRYPVYNMISGAIFLDVGNVWTETFDYKINELRYSLGTGIGVNTPIGPVRIDLARPIFDPEDDFQLHFNVGHAF
jgi:outer membrane protein insertion porin family